MALFVLIAALVVTVVFVAQRRVPERQRAELRAWQEAESTGTIAAYESYRERFAGRSHSGEALARLDALRLEETLARSFSAPDPIARAYAAIEWGSKGAEGAPAIPHLVKLLADHHSLEWSNPPSSRDSSTSPGQEAALALVQIGSASIEPLLAVMESGTFTSRANAAVALGRLKDPRALDPLLAALQDEHRSVREGAAKGLKELGDRRAVEPLIALLAREKDVATLNVGAWVLTRLTGRDFGTDAKAWQQWWKQGQAERTRGGE